MNLWLERTTVFDWLDGWEGSFAEDVITRLHAFKLCSKFKYTAKIKGAKLPEDNHYDRLYKVLSKSIEDYFEPVLPVEGFKRSLLSRPDAISTRVVPSQSKLQSTKIRFGGIRMK